MSELNVLVFTDAGEEIDDQIALWHLSNNRNYKLAVIFCGNGDEQYKRMERWTELALQMHIHLFTLTLDSFKRNHAPFHYHAILQISPLFGFDSDRITTDKYVLMGTVDDSVNCPKGSVDLFRRFQSKPGTIVIESSEAALHRPTKEFIKQIPEVLLEEMIKVGFRLVTKRCDPNAVHAEGLINDAVGRGANYKSVENMYQAVFKRPQTTFCVRKDTDEYIDSLIKKSDKIEETRIKMYKMYKSLEDVFGFRVPVNYIHDAYTFGLFKAIALEHPEILNPMYDYFASTFI